MWHPSGTSNGTWNQNRREGGSDASKGINAKLVDSEVNVELGFTSAQLLATLNSTSRRLSTTSTRNAFRRRMPTTTPGAQCRVALGSCVTTVSNDLNANFFFFEKKKLGQSHNQVKERSRKSRNPQVGVLPVAPLHMGHLTPPAVGAWRKTGCHPFEGLFSSPAHGVTCGIYSCTSDRVRGAFSCDRAHTQRQQ